MTKGAGQMINNDATMKEKRDVLRNEQRTTLSQFAQAEAAEARGRFTAHERSTVVGASSVPKYPAAFLQYDPVPDEPALGVDINEMEPCGQPHELKASALEPSCLPSPAQATPSPSSQVVPPLHEGLGFSSRTYRRF